MNQLELDRHHELTAFLRSRRARISPEQVGLPKGTRRRTPGLRRGEVALLAGVTPEWYTWLEQGRDIHVSEQLLESLARVLLLDANERAHLFLLALRQQPPPVETFSPTTISPTMQQFLDQLGTSPACVVDPRLNVVAWNAAFRVCFGDFATQTARERNLIWLLFTHPVRQANEEWRNWHACIWRNFALDMVVSSTIPGGLDRSQNSPGSVRSFGNYGPVMMCRALRKDAKRCIIRLSENWPLIFSGSRRSMRAICDY